MEAMAREFQFHNKYCGGGLTFYPYQIACGISLRYWKCIFAPSVRIHFLCWKIWFYWKSKQEQ